MNSANAPSYWYPIDSRFSQTVSWPRRQKWQTPHGIAARGDEHVGLLARLAEVLVVPEQAARLRSVERVEDVLAILGSPLEGASQ